MHEINLEARPVGRPSIAVQRLRNLIGAAEHAAPVQARADG